MTERKEEKRHISTEFFNEKEKTKDWGGGYGKRKEAKKHYSQLSISVLNKFVRKILQRKARKNDDLIVYIYVVYIYRRDVITRREKE